MWAMHGWWQRRKCYAFSLVHATLEWPIQSSFTCFSSWISIHVHHGLCRTATSNHKKTIRFCIPAYIIFIIYLEDRILDPVFWISGTSWNNIVFLFKWFYIQECARYHHISSNIIIYHHASPYIIISSCIIIYHHKSKTYHHISSYIIKKSYIIKYHHILFFK